MHDYLSKTKSSDFHYFVLPIGTVRGKPLTASGRPTKSDISTLIQYTTLWFYRRRMHAPMFGKYPK